VQGEVGRGCFCSWLAAKSDPTPTPPYMQGGSKGCKSKKATPEDGLLLVRIGGRYKDRTCDPFHVKDGKQGSLKSVTVVNTGNMVPIRSLKSTVVFRTIYVLAFFPREHVMIDLTKVVTRDKLKYRREPYWQKLAKGQYLGFRPSQIGKGGTWIARYYDSETQRNDVHSLGEFGNLPGSDRFTAASAEARTWFDHRSGGGSAKMLTVRDACERYAADKPDAAKRFPRYVYNDPIAKAQLHKLTDRQVRDWRKRLEDMPAQVSKRKDGSTTTRDRAVSSVNRDMVPFRAALNQALGQGDVLTARAWKAALEPTTTKTRRTLYLTRDQRRALLEAMPSDAAAFCRGLCLLPLRPGALAALLVKDFDKHTGELHIRDDKAGAGRRLMLPVDASALFRAQASSKMPTTNIFTRADGSPWNKDAWKHPVKDAARTAGLPAETTAYTMRHSTITDLVTGGLDLLTTAQVSGTSVRMIEQHYGHLQSEHAQAALAKLAL